MIKELMVDFDGVKTYLEECERIANEAHELVLFGSAKGGEKVWKFLSDNGNAGKIIAVIDNDLSKQGTKFHGVDINGIDRLMDLYNSDSNFIIIIASGSAHIIKRQLLQKGISEDRINQFVFTNLQTNPTPYEFFQDHIEELERVYSLLEDEKSREVYLGLINFKISMDSKYLKDIADNENSQYFDDVMKYTDEEYFVDCGAYVGDTLELYSSIVSNKWKQYYLFEADSDVYATLCNNVDKGGYDNVLIYNKGLWSERNTLHFDCLGSGSSVINERGNVVVEVDALDNILEGKNVTTIKMDIEGAETNALKGSRNIIKNQQPRLAISIYHSLEDFVNIPLLIHAMNNEYKLYIRHYRELTDSETICYAVL